MSPKRSSSVDVLACARENSRHICLRSGVCMRDFFGWAACEHVCDRVFVDDLKNGVMANLIDDMMSRVPVVVRQKMEKRLKNVYCEEAGGDE